MARRGRFGRRRPGSTNLTTLIASLMREQKAAEDRVMFDAYQNGGLVDGKPVTDDRMLKYMESRRDGFSTDDPLWDEWDNRVRQQKFSIGEQKIGLAFKQGKVGAGAVAAFYRSQLNSIPKDSAFYREVAGRAADWAKAAGNAARGAARARAGAGQRAQYNSLLQKGAQYEALEQALTEYARREGLIAGTQTLTDADATELRAMFDRGIYKNGTDRITLGDFRDAGIDYYKSLVKRSEIQVALGNQGVEDRNKAVKFMEQTLVRLNTIPERSQYELARDSWEAAIAAANGDPVALKAANDRYAKQLTDIQANTGLQTDFAQNDPEFIGALGNEIAALTTGEPSGPTVFDLMSNTGEGVSTTDAESSAQSVKGLNADLDALNSGKAYYGQNEPNGPLSVIYPTTPLGQGLDDSLQPSMTTINGEKRLVYLKGEAVKSSVFEVDGQVLDPASPTFQQDIARGRANGTLEITESKAPIGYIFTNPSNGTVKYGVYDAAGNMLFTDTSPWATQDGTGITRNGETPIVATTAGSKGPQGPLPLTTGLTTRPIDIATADPLLSDSTVAPKDLLALTAQGITGFSEEDLAAYTERLRVQEQKRLQALTQRDMGLQDTLGIGRPEDSTVAGGGDLPAATLALMRSIQGAQQTILSPNQAKDDWASPPPMPKLAPPPTWTQPTQPSPTSGTPPTPPSINGPQGAADPYSRPDTNTPNPTPGWLPQEPGWTPPPEEQPKPVFNPPPKPGQTHL